jgi:hypothetical protein
MNRRAGIAGFAVMLLPWIAVAPAWAGVIDTFTMTPNGANTDFTITGNYPSDSATNFYSAPFAPYSLTFVLPTTPSSLDSVDTVDGIFALDTVVTVNGFSFLNSQIAFFVPDFGGGLDVCLNEECGPDPPVLFDRWATFGDALFTGTVLAPTFVAGSPFVDPSQSFIEIPAPEPAPLGMAAGGIGVMALLLRRRLARGRIPPGIVAQIANTSGKRSSPIF